MKFLSMPIAIITLLLSLYGCSSMPMLEQFVAKPKLAVADFSMSEASFLNQTFQIKLKVDNPNAFALPILGLDYGLNIAGVEVAKGNNTKSLTVPAGGTDYLDISVNTNLLKTLPDLKSVLMGGGKDISYAITGNVQTKNSFISSIPFAKTGQFEFSF